MDKQSGTIEPRGARLALSYRRGAAFFSVPDDDGDLATAYFLQFLEKLAAVYGATPPFESDMRASVHGNVCRFLQYIGDVAGGSVVLNVAPAKAEPFAAKCREYFSYLAAKCEEQGIDTVSAWQDGIPISPGTDAESVVRAVVQETVDHLFDFYVEGRVNAIPRSGPVQFVSSADDSHKSRSYFYCGEQTAIVETHFDAHLFLNLRNFSLTPTILKTGWWEPWNDILLRSLLKPGMSFVNAGANIGYHTILGAKLVEHFGKVFAFEPSPEAYALLKKAVFFNGFSGRTRLYNAAVVDPAEGPVCYFLAGGEGGGSMVGAAPPPSSGPPPSLREDFRHIDGVSMRTKVLTITLDKAIRDEVDQVDVLMMDIEGSEGAAILGGSALIEASRDLKIIMEWSFTHTLAESRVKLEQAVAFLVAQRFAFYRIVPPSGNVYTQPPDLVFVDPQDLFGLPHCDLFVTRS